MSGESVRKHRQNYAVTWHSGDGPNSCGSLEVGDEDLVLHGPTDAEEFRIPLDELSSIGIGRRADERINGDRSLVLERTSGERVLVGAIALLGGAGLVEELNELLARLRAERTAGARIAVVLPIKRGMAEAARELVEQGPPFELEALGLERHHVFVSEREVVFFFEGEKAADTVDALLRSPDLLIAAVRWRRVLAGRPRLAEERFGWARGADKASRVVRSRARAAGVAPPDADRLSESQRD
jgi:hypothetical protein